MSWKMSLEIARKPNSSQFDEEMRRGVTMSKWATIADLMLFDRSSLAEAQSGWETDRVFLIDTQSAAGRPIGFCCRSAPARSSASDGGCRAYWRR
jgi:hypothetical protein